MDVGRRTLPPEHRNLYIATGWLGASHLAQERFEQAEPLLRESLTARQAVQPHVADTLRVQALLASALIGQTRDLHSTDPAAEAKFTKAESLLLDAYEGMQPDAEAIPPQRQRRIADVLQRLIDLYVAWEKPDAAAEWQRKLDLRSAP